MRREIFNWPIHGTICNVQPFQGKVFRLERVLTNSRRDGEAL